MVPLSRSSKPGAAGRTGRETTLRREGGGVGGGEGGSLRRLLAMTTRTTATTVTKATPSRGPTTTGTVTPLSRTFPSPTKNFEGDECDIEIIFHCHIILLYGACLLLYIFVIKIIVHIFFHSHFYINQS